MDQKTSEKYEEFLDNIARYRYFTRSTGKHFNKISNLEREGSELQKKIVHLESYIQTQKNIMNLSNGVGVKSSNKNKKRLNDMKKELKNTEEKLKSVMRRLEYHQ